MVQPHSELVVRLAERLRGDESICPSVGQREQRQDLRCGRINGSEKSHLVERHWCAKERELSCGIAADYFLNSETQIVCSILYHRLQ